jgi:hypothetical protein
MRNRFEDFYNLPVTVKERKSLDESLRKNLEGEVISDYECPGCKKKVDITKRTLISKTPNVLVVQLQRLVFDFDTFQNQKVNSYFEFPEALDLTPFSLNEVLKKEGKLDDKLLGNKKEGESDNEGEEGEDEYEGMTDEERKERQEEKQEFQNNVQYNSNECYEYKLVGVIIHVGTADAGHYYSFINTDRFQKDNEHEDEWMDTSKDKWMEFNDSRVSDYNFEDLKADSFGGSAGNDDWFGGMFKSNSYGKSAYLLVYEKRFKKPVIILAPENEDGTPKHKIPENAEIKTIEKTGEKYYEMDMKNIGMFVPNKIYKEIWEDNLEFSFEKLIYSNEFYDFVKELMNGTLGFKEKYDSLKPEDQKQVDTVISNMAKVGNKIAYGVLAKAYHNYKLPSLSDSLIQLYEASDTAVLTTMDWILEEENSDDFLYVYKVLLSCNDRISRVNVAKLLSALVNRCFEIEKDIINETEKVTIKVTEELISTGKDEESSKEVEREVIRPKSKAVRFWDLTMEALRQKGPSNWSKFEQFLTMIRNIAVGGETQLNMIIQRGSLIGFIDFMLGQNSPNHKAGEKRTKMGSVYATPNFGPLLEAVSHMILRCYTPMFNKDSERIPETFNKEASTHYDLSQEDIDTFILHEEFLKIAILNSSEALGNALSHVSFQNLDASRKIGKVILKTINTSDYEKIQQCMIVAKPFLYINDDFQRNRAEWILGFSCLNMKANSHSELPRFGVAGLSHVGDEAYHYISPLEISKSDHALLALLWRYRGKMDLYVVNCLNILLETIVGNQFLSEYMFNLDPPTYEFARFTDWIRPYLQKELEKCHRSMSSYMRSNKKEESIMKCFSYLEIYEKSLEQFQRKLKGLPEEAEESKKPQPEEEKKKEEDDFETPPSVIEAHPKRYIINCVTKMEEIKQEEKDGFVVTVFKAHCQYAESQPTLVGNNTLPSYAFHNAKLEASEFDRKCFMTEMDNERGEDSTQPRTEVSNLDDEENVHDGVSKISVNKKEGEEDLETSDWNLPKNETDFILIARVENNNTKSFTFKMKLVCDDELAKSNIKAPINEIEATVRPMFSDIWIDVHKIDPEKDWGEFHFEWSYEEKKPETSYGRMDYSERDAQMYNQMMQGPSIPLVNYYGI